MQDMQFVYNFYVIYSLPAQQRQIQDLHIYNLTCWLKYIANHASVCLLYSCCLASEPHMNGAFADRPTQV